MIGTRKSGPSSGKSSSASCGFAEAELRSQRDFAEELLAGADESTVTASAHVLGYDPHRPHRVIIATGRPRGGLGEQFF